MGKVAEQVVALVQKQVQDSGIVVWYDPERAYDGLVAGLDLPGTALLRFEDSFFALRERLEPFLEPIGEDGRLTPEAATPPRVLVYVPRERRETRNALIEAEAAGAVIEPGANAWQRNSRLRVIAERVFKEIAPDRASEIARQVEQGSLTLADLDRLAEQSAEIGAGAVTLLFGTASVADVTLAFAASDEYDQQIAAKHALPELAGLFSVGLGIRIDPHGSFTDARRTLRRGLLLGDLVAGLTAEARPKALMAAVPSRPSHLEALRQLGRTWRNRTDYREAYAEAARGVEAEAGVARLDLDPTVLAEVETFPSIEGRLLLHAEERVLAGAAREAIDLARRRKPSFWSVYEPTNQLRWSIVETAARLLLEGDRVKAGLIGAEREPAAMVQAYADGDEPWCLLDTLHRHLERQWSTFDLEVGGEHDRLEQVIHRARQRYTETVRLCAEAFTAALEAADFELDGLLSQRSVFPTLVAPRVKGGGKVAYVWVDALRFEMGRELLEGLGDDFETSLAPAVAQLPSITEVGMAALLPGADGPIELVEAAASKLGIKLGSTVVKDRASRVRYLRETVGGAAVDLKLNEAIKPSRRLRDEIARADFVLVTSQEIDRRGEEADDEEEARRFMDEVLDKLRKGIRRLASLGVTDFVIAADHGYLFGEAVESGMKIDAPGGKTVDLHRRVWVGRGGSAAAGYVRVPAGRVGLGGDLELAFPRSLACFTAKGGSTAYFHGGASLQELVIPVAVVHAKKSVPSAGVGQITLTMERPKVTTRFFSVTATYAVTDLFGGDERRVRLSVRANRQEIGAAATAAYGFEEGTGEIVLRRETPNAITLMLTGETDARTASVHVLDAATGVELASLGEIALDIAL